MTKSAGIHHVTAISGEPQRTVDFYAGLLGLRLVKRTVNFDDPGTYHLYLGDERGRPGTLLTFFAWDNARPGTPGVGQVTSIALAVPRDSLAFWRDRLTRRGVKVASKTRFGDEMLAFRDPDGIGLELVAASDREPEHVWEGGPVPVEHAIGGVHHATLSLDVEEGTQEVLERVLGFRAADEEGNRWRFRAGDRGAGRLVDLVEAPQLPVGAVARGTVHHIAFRAADDGAQAAMRREVEELGLRATHVLDRNYFRSVYFREPGGILFEIATDDPGFSVDEPVERLGEHLKLPAWLEPRRDELEARLAPLRMPGAPGEVSA